MARKTGWISQGDVRRVMIPAAIFPELVVGLPAARVYAALALRANNVTGLVDSTWEQIAADSGLSRSQVAAGLRDLIEGGWLMKVRQGHSRASNKYRLLASPVAPAEFRAATEGGEAESDGPEIETVNGPETRTVPEVPEGPETRTVNGPERETLETESEGPETRTEGSGNPDLTVRKSGPPLVSPTTKETELATQVLANADASPGDEPVVVEAELVDDDESGLFEINGKPAKPKTSKRPSGRKANAPLVLRHGFPEPQPDWDASDAIRRIVGAWVEAYESRGVRPADKARGQAASEIKALIEVGNNPNLVDAVARRAGERGHATVIREVEILINGQRGNQRADPEPSTGDLRVIKGEWLKAAPDWGFLAHFGVTPENAHLYGYRPSQSA